MTSIQPEAFKLEFVELLTQPIKYAETPLVNFIRPDKSPGPGEKPMFNKKKKKILRKSNDNHFG